MWYYYVVSDYFSAVHHLQLSSEQGSSYASACLGVCYYRGYGISEPSPRKAVEMFRKAADAGDCLGLECLSVCYHNGAGAHRNVALSAELLQRVIILDPFSGKALHDLAVVFDRGDDVQRDHEKALELYKYIIFAAFQLSYLSQTFC